MAPFWKENQSVWKKKKEFIIRRTNMQARVQLKDSICFKQVQIGS
jgi:hypothetical protein